MSEPEVDITQDPEYIRGYEQGVERHKKDQSAWNRGFRAGFNAHKTPEAVEDDLLPSETAKDKVSSQPCSESECCNKPESKSESKDTISVTVSCTSQQTQERMLALLERCTEMSGKLADHVKDLDQRLKALEKYTKE